MTAPGYSTAAFPAPRPITSNPSNPYGEPAAGIFDFMVRDMSQHALTLSLQASSTEKQMELCQKMLRKPLPDCERYERVWEKQVRPLDGAYEMTP